jgi:hypothetical protein
VIGARLQNAPRYAAWSDAVVRRTLAELKQFTDWCAAQGVQGYIGEFGWPWSQDGEAWNNTARAYVREINRLKLFYSLYACSGHLHADKLGMYTDLGGTGDPRVITTVRPNAAVAEANIRRATFSVTIPDPDFGVGTLNSNGGIFSNFNPGTINTDYFYPSTTDLQFLASRGVKIIRLTFQWERLQPTLGAALYSAELTRLTNALNTIASLGMKAIITPHNFGGYKIGTSNSSAAQYYLTTDTAQPVHVNHFSNLWTRVATAFNNHAGIYGYALMNEPTGITPITGPYGPNLVGSGTFESTTEGWAGTGASVARSSTQAHAGTASLASTASANGNAGAFSPSFAVTSGLGYAASCYMRAAATPRKGAINIDWHASNDAYISSASGTQVTDSTTGWTLLSVAGTAPANATKANITIKAYSSLSGEVTYIDDVLCQTSSVVSAPKIWESVSQAAVDAIRATSDTHPIYVPGYAFSHPHVWASNHPVSWITDPANNFGYEAHHYWDTSHSGTYMLSYAQELTNAISAGY